MFKYLVILLDDTSVSYCHYTNNKKQHNPISIEHLKAGILYAMKENLNIQFVYPDYELSQSHKELIETIDHSKIVPTSYTGTADVMVVEDWKDFSDLSFQKETSYVLRTSKNDLFSQYFLLENILGKVSHLSIVLTDIETFNNSDFDSYKETLKDISGIVETYYKKGVFPQINLLTDRMMLQQMNNCNAGYENIRF